MTFTFSVMIERDVIRLHLWQQIEELLYAALARGERTLKIEISVNQWIIVLDDLKGQAPRNYSRLVRDDTIERMNEAIDRLHDEINYMIVHGKGNVADAFPRRRRDVASEALKRSMKDRNV